MLTAQQQEFIEAIEALDIKTIQQSLAQGLDVNFIAPEKGLPISIVCDGIFDWWEVVSTAYTEGTPFTEQQKQQKLQIHLDILDALIAAGANVHLWDAEEFYGPLWDCSSAACVPAVQRLLNLNVNPNTKDDEDLTILSSVSQLFFDCDYDDIDWSEALPEEQQTLQLLREHGAKMSKELSV
ncbi:ankyrin repeat domain-containing protein [Acinetobacter sp. B5B]|uniref:ankyrin repeat domain-containing protein n=1 Tax=Acinetobacter baretiae TaxID=2605383 RepID=UPI0018C215F7|nr:ankyrin repeat domain-containing protein [Acinetobacter baretiae]MBF7681837.1 ankyrin repeat domain-containing protein [Acinetobacter baretiae]MBF7686228.1 ankyrin repeat domain-containing protein [Acinetobacter baretiae]